MNKAIYCVGKSTKVSEIEVINQSIGRSMVAPIFIGANLYGGWLNVSLNVKQPIISLMILRVETTPKSSSIGGRKISPQRHSIGDIA